MKLDSKNNAEAGQPQPQVPIKLLTSKQTKKIYRLPINTMLKVETSFFYQNPQK